MKRLIPALLLSFFPTAAAIGESKLVPADTGLTLDRKVASVLPSEREDCWLKIPWHTNLVAAMAEAQRQGRPLYLWVMDGNPLGCG